MATYLITGSSRGLGLTLIEALAARLETECEWSSQLPSTERGQVGGTDRQTGRVVYVPLDVTDQESITTALKQVQHQLEDN